MNGSKISIIPVLFLLLLACSNNRQGEDVLSKPPFAALTDSIRQFPGNAGLRMRRGELLSQHNQHELAYLDYKTVWEKEKAEYVVRPYVSNLIVVNRADETIAVLEEAMKRFPGNPEFRRRLSEAYNDEGMPDKALELYNSILRTDSANFEPWYEKGLLLTYLKDTAGAIRAFERSFALQPLTMNGIPLANLYAETKNPAALLICDEIIAKDTTLGSIEAFFVKGLYYSNTKQYRQAIDQFQDCIRKDWKYIEAYIEKGIALLEQKNFDEALQTFKLASSISPRDADTYYWQGRCYEAIGKKEEAMDKYIQAYALDRTNKEAKEHIDNLRKSH